MASYYDTDGNPIQPPPVSPGGVFGVPGQLAPPPSSSPRPPPRFSPHIDGVIGSAASRYGLDPDVMRRIAYIESGGNPNSVTGSYRGLYQLSNSEFAKHGGGNVFDPQANAFAGAAKLRFDSDQFKRQYGRDPTASELYLIHQQGAGGAANHWRNPERPAWQNMLDTAEGRQKAASRGQAYAENWARSAIWGNVPDTEKSRYGSVDNITSRDFTALWDRKVSGSGGAAPAVQGVGGAQTGRQGLMPDMQPGQFGQWTPEDVIQGRRSLGNEYLTGVRPMGAWAGLFAGLNGALREASANSTSYGNQGMRDRAMSAAANAPMGSLSALLMGSGVPDLAKAGLAQRAELDHFVQTQPYKLAAEKELLKMRGEQDIEQMKLKFPEELKQKLALIEAEKKLARQMERERWADYDEVLKSVVPGQGRAPADPSDTRVGGKPAPPSIPDEYAQPDAAAQPAVRQPPPARPQAQAGPVKSGAFGSEGMPTGGSGTGSSGGQYIDDITAARLLLRGMSKDAVERLAGGKSGDKFREEWDKTRATNLGKRWDSVIEAGQKSSQRLDDLNRLQDLILNPKLSQGPGTEGWNAVKRFGELFGVRTEGLPLAQAFAAVSNKMALAERDPSTGAGMPGAMSDADRSFLAQIVPSLGNTPEANMIIIEASRRIAQRNMRIAQMATQYAQNNHGVVDEKFYAYVQDQAEAHPLFSDLIEAVKTKLKPGSGKGPRQSGGTSRGLLPGNDNPAPAAASGKLSFQDLPMEARNEAIKRLREDPSPATIANFERVFGDVSAKDLLAGRGDAFGGVRVPRYVDTMQPKDGY